MKSLFDDLSRDCSRITTRKYSTSFSLGILFLNRKLRAPVYAIYGFVRLADEIVDSFHGYDKARLLSDFRRETEDALVNKISLNPILNAFQEAVHQYNISKEWIDHFMVSMEMDLHKVTYTGEAYRQYIYGSAEVVGLMCLHVFTEGDPVQFDKLKPYARKLGAAFQKVNFLRDLKDDNELLDRSYFPDVDLTTFSADDKRKIEKEIEADFTEALTGIKMLPESSRNGVFLAYCYYQRLFKKIRKLPSHRIMNERVRIPNYQKLMLMVTSNLRHQLNIF